MLYQDWESHVHRQSPSPSLSTNQTHFHSTFTLFKLPAIIQKATNVQRNRECPSNGLRLSAPPPSPPPKKKKKKPNHPTLTRYRAFCSVNYEPLMKGFNWPAEVTNAAPIVKTGDRSNLPPSTALVTKQSSVTLDTSAPSPLSTPNFMALLSPTRSVYPPYTDLEDVEIV